MNILLAVDGSSHSTWAEKQVSALAGVQSHRVDVVFVSPQVFQSPGASFKTVPELLKENGLRMLALVEKGLKKNGRLKVRTHLIESSDVAGTLLLYARRFRSSLMVLGARGKTPVQTFFLGSVANRVSRHASLSVMIARKPGRSRDLRVALMLDGSKTDGRVVSFLKRLSLPRRTQITLVHTVTDPLLLWAMDEEFYGKDLKWPNTLREAHQKGRRLLKRWEKNLKAPFPRVKTRLLEGHVAGEIIHYANKRSFDWVILGRRRLPRVDRFLLGSVSQKVSSYLERTVLIVH